MYNESNNYCEVLIAREPDQKALLTARVFLALAILTGVLGLLWNLLFFILTILLALLYRQKVSGAAVEFEYQFWGRQLDVDCIRNASSRRKLVTYQMDEAEILAREDDPVLERYQALLGSQEPVRTRDFTDGDPEGRPVYVLYAREGTDLVRVRLQPTHEMLRQMWRVTPNLVHIPASIRQEPETEEGLED